MCRVRGVADGSRVFQLLNQGAPVLVVADSAPDIVAGVRGTGPRRASRECGGRAQQARAVSIVASFLLARSDADDISRQSLVSGAEKS
jgi:hypothetical protein